MLNAVLADVKTVRSVLTKTLFKLSNNAARFVTVVALMVTLNGRLTLVLLAGLPFSVYLNYSMTAV